MRASVLSGTHSQSHMRLIGEEVELLKHMEEMKAGGERGAGGPPGCAAGPSGAPGPARAPAGPAKVRGASAARRARYTLCAQPPIVTFYPGGGMVRALAVPGRAGVPLTSACPAAATTCAPGLAAAACSPCTRSQCDRRRRRSAGLREEGGVPPRALLRTCCVGGGRSLKEDAGVQAFRDPNPFTYTIDDFVDQQVRACASAAP
jgi:hypothetical protein